MRHEPLQSELFGAITLAIRDVPGVTEVDHYDREMWYVGGTLAGDQLVESISSVLHHFEPLVRAERGPYACPCCGYLTRRSRRRRDLPGVLLSRRRAGRSPRRRDLGRTNYDLSLTEARNNFKTLGAVNEAMRQHTRPPRPEGIPRS
jgi:hypothetical protein